MKAKRRIRELEGIVASLQIRVDDLERHAWPQLFSSTPPKVSGVVTVNLADLPLSQITFADPRGE